MLSATLSVGQTLMVFNAVNGSSSLTETLTLTNSGDAELAFGSISVANDPNAASQDASRFSVLNSAPTTLDPGSSFGLQVQFNANAVTTNSALLDISSNDPTTPTQVVTLHGIGTRGLGGTNQPSLATILQAYDIPTLVGEGPNDANASTDVLYPEPPDPSSQEVVLQRLQKAGTGPVTIQVLASFTASGTKPYTLGTYTPGVPNSLNELFFTPSTESQSTYVQPEGATSFDPGTSEFGFYFLSNVQVQGRIGYSEDSLNPWDTTDPRKIRFFPLENADGTVVPNAYILTTTEWSDPSGYDFTNIVAIVRNVQAAPGSPTGPAISLTDPNAIVGSNNMIFSRIESPNTALGDIEHSTGVLDVTNTGSSPLIISSYSISNTSAFALSSPPSFPLTIAAGATVDLTVKFKATGEPKVPYNETNSPAYGSGGGVYSATLTLNTNDPNNASIVKPLEGWYQYHSENSNEPGLQTIVNLLAGYTTEINPTPITELTESSNTSNSVPTYYGQEVVSAYFQEADTGIPVTVDQIAAYHTEGNPTVTYYTSSNSGSSTKLMTTANDSGQSMFPILTSTNNSSNPAIATFSNSGTFGFRVDAEYSDNSKNTTLMTGGGHHFRFYPILTSNGTLVPNTYIMCMDYSNTPQNFDFQDNVYIVSNIRPVQNVANISSPQTTGAPAAPSDFYSLNVTGGNYLQWAPSLTSSVTGYNLYRSSSSAGPYTLLNTSPLTALTYTDTTAPATGTSYYKVTAVGTVESLGATTSIVNAGTVTGGGGGAPVAANETRNTLAGTAVVIDVAADATDNGVGTISPTTVIVTTNPTNGTTSVDPTTGDITYTPAAGFTGTDTFTYTIGDSTNATSAAATITINVSATAVGDPVAGNLTLTAAADASLTIPVVASCTDDTATLDPSTVTITQEPTHGSASVDTTTGNIIYTPTPGYIGPDMILYTIGDSLQAISSPGIITLTVKFSGPTVANLSATTLNGASTTVDVVAAATDLSGTIAPTSVAITTGPTRGNATINPTTGVITYTPSGSFVGTDTLQYTISDVNGTVSDTATITFNVGVLINSTTAKTLTFTDTGGDLVTVTLAGGGSASVFFNGQGNLATTAVGKTTSKLSVTGSGIGIASISATGTSFASSLVISRKGVSIISIGSITVAGPINKITATSTSLNGTLTVSGALGTLQLASASGATITIGSQSAPKAGFVFTVGNVTDTSLTSAIPIHSLKATSWSASAGATIQTITAPSIASLITTGNFQANLVTTGGSPFSLGTVHVGGQVAADTWTITGTANSLNARLIAGWLDWQLFSNQCAEHPHRWLCRHD